MKRTLRVLLLMVMAVLLVTACAKQPTEEMAATKTAVDALVAAEGDKYAPAETSKVKADYDAAMAEIKVQDGKLFKNYDKAKELLTSSKTGAAAATELAAKKKEEAKQAAMAGETEAKAAVEQAVALIKKAPSGKGTTEDVEALRNDVKGLEEAAASLAGMIGSGDYLGAVDKAKAIKAKADEVSAQIKQAIEKKSKKKGAKKEVKKGKK